MSTEFLNARDFRPKYMNKRLEELYEDEQFCSLIKRFENGISDAIKFGEISFIASYTSWCYDTYIFPNVKSNYKMYKIYAPFVFIHFKNNGFKIEYDDNYDFFEFDLSEFQIQRNYKFN